MSDNHLHPNRGWSLINDSEQFTPEEIAHLKDCLQCSEWIALFAEVARTAGSTTESETPFYVVADEHMTPARGWFLIRDRGHLEPHELAHLQYCRRCNDWLKTFTRFAHKAGFTIAFQIPPCEDTPDFDAGG
jgi:predicted anti-sigma-YlaC factor YlaD